MASSSRSKSNDCVAMHSIEYYFGNPSLSVDRGTTTPPIVLDIRCKKKRPVGRPRKLTKTDPSSSTLPASRLVDYSSTESEADHVNAGAATSTCNDEAEARKQPKKLRKMYSKGQKKKVADYARFHGVRKAAKEFKVSHSNVIRWKKEVSRIRNPSKRSHRRGQGRKVSYPKDLEDKLVAWILEKRETDCVAVSTQVIRCKALSLIRSVRPKHKIAAFRREVASIFENSDFPLDYVCNMDETPVFLDLVPSRVVDRKGKKTINVRTTASEKNRITATLCCTASGKMLPPFVVFKGKTKRGIKKVPVPHGVVCTTQAKGWMDEERMLEWIQKVWTPYVDGNRALLSLDTFSGHLTDRVKDALDKCGTKMLVIPGGCTSVLQPLDVSINKPFKAYIRQSWCERMVSEAETGVAKITPASKAILMEWIKTAADLVEKKPNTIKKSFEVTGIVNKPDCTRSDALFKEVQDVLDEVFGQVHMGYVEPTGDPFADSESDSESDEPEDASDQVPSDPFLESNESECDTDDSELAYSEITDIEDASD